MSVNDYVPIDNNSPRSSISNESVNSDKSVRNEVKSDRKAYNTAKAIAITGIALTAILTGLTLAAAITTSAVGIFPAAIPLFAAALVIPILGIGVTFAVSYLAYKFLTRNKEEDTEKANNHFKDLSITTVNQSSTPVKIDLDIKFTKDDLSEIKKREEDRILTETLEMYHVDAAKRIPIKINGKEFKNQNTIETKMAELLPNQEIRTKFLAQLSQNAMIPIVNKVSEKLLPIQPSWVRSVDLNDENLKIRNIEIELKIEENEVISTMTMDYVAIDIEDLSHIYKAPLTYVVKYDKDRAEVKECTVELGSFEEIEHSVA